MARVDGRRPRHRREQGRTAAARWPSAMGSRGRRPKSQISDSRPPRCGAPRARARGARGRQPRDRRGRTWCGARILLRVSSQPRAPRCFQGVASESGGDGTAASSPASPDRDSARSGDAQPEATSEGTPEATASGGSQDSPSGGSRPPDADVGDKEEAGGRGESAGEEDGEMARVYQVDAAALHDFVAKLMAERQVEVDALVRARALARSLACARLAAGLPSASVLHALAAARAASRVRYVHTRARAARAPARLNAAVPVSSRARSANDSRVGATECLPLL